MIAKDGDLNRDLLQKGLAEERFAFAVSPYFLLFQMLRQIPNKHLFLFLATLFTTSVAGAMQAGANPFIHMGLLASSLRDPNSFLSALQLVGRDLTLISKGFPFSFSLMFILLTHECGHYIVSRKRGISATLPYFIPFPFLSPLGTLGAFIKMKSPVPNRRALLDVGASGPLAGFAVAIPAVIIGLKLSEVRPHMPSQGISLGSSLIFSFLSRLFVNADLQTHDIILHPVAFAGWIGILVTALNLLPVGQLDGGHVFYALFGKKHNVFAIFTFGALMILGWQWQGWYFWALIILIFGFRHPPLIDEFTPLGFKRKVIGAITIAIFILSFTPVPLSI